MIHASIRTGDSGTPTAGLPPSSSRHTARLWGAAASVLFLAGCAATLPDLSPFTARTADLATAVDAGLTETGRLLAEAGAPADRIRNFEVSGNRLSSMFHGLLGYADALNDVARAGKKGDESARAVADAVGGLLGTLGAGPVAPTVAAGVTEANRIVAAIRARNSLADAVKSAQPAVDSVAATGVRLVETLATLSESALLETENRERAESQSLLEYVAHLKAEERSVLDLLSLYMEVRDGSGDALRLLPERDPVMAQLQAQGNDLTPRLLEDRENSLTARAATLRTQLDAYRDRHTAALARLSAISRQTVSARDLFRSCRRAVLAWQRAHTRLTEALQTDIPMSLEEMAATARHLREFLSQGDLR